jgi:hypothetical protein
LAGDTHSVRSFEHCVGYYTLHPRPPYLLYVLPFYYSKGLGCIVLLVGCLKVERGERVYICTKFELSKPFLSYGFNMKVHISILALRYLFSNRDEQRKQQNAILDYFFEDGNKLSQSDSGNLRETSILATRRLPQQGTRLQSHSSRVILTYTSFDAYHST